MVAFQDERAMTDFEQLYGSAGAACRAAVSGVRPFAEPTVTSATVGGTQVSEPQSYLSLFAGPSSDDDAHPDAADFVPIVLHSKRPSPWTDARYLTYSPSTGALERGASVVQLPPATVDAIAAGESLDGPAAGGGSDFAWPLETGTLAVVLALGLGTLLLVRREPRIRQRPDSVTRAVATRPPRPSQSPRSGHPPAPTLVGWNGSSQRCSSSTSSTRRALVAASDPEVVRRRVTRFFDRVSHCITAHGGIVEKFAGDAVMAAFGIPQAHEDDAERAIRAALAILDSVHDLGLEARIGVESGEVVADDTDSTFATGEAVNVAARLQQEAGPGEILLGPTAHRLTLGRVVVEDHGLLDLRGLATALPTWRASSP